MHYYSYYGIIAMLPVIILGLIVQANLKKTYSAYSKLGNSLSMNGAQMAEFILKNAGIHDVQVNCVQGNLSDHYNPNTKTVNLSKQVYEGTTIAAIGVAAHECGHAIQHHEAYFPLRVRSAAVGITNFSSRSLYFLILLSLIFSSHTFGALIFDIAIVCYLVVFLFQLITLPVEFNASSRAIHIIGGAGFDSTDVKGVRKVLTAAALTYVSAAVTALWQLLLMLNRRRRS